jgi:hypothetical protein
MPVGAIVTVRNPHQPKSVVVRAELFVVGNHDSSFLMPPELSSSGTDSCALE